MQLFYTILHIYRMVVAVSLLSHVLIFCDPPGSLVHGISQARILEYVAISFSRGLSRLGDRTRVLAGRFFATEPPGKHLLQGATKHSEGLNAYKAFNTGSVLNRFSVNVNSCYCF